MKRRPPDRQTFKEEMHGEEDGDLYEGESRASRLHLLDGSWDLRGAEPRQAHPDHSCICNLQRHSQSHVPNKIRSA